MILVTLGTHPQPMDRLLRAIDDLVEAGVIDDVTVQAAAYAYRPRHARIEGVRPFGWLHEQICAADVVITHAGPATIAVVRATGRIPVVVPRYAAHGEHVDDHQLRYAAHLQGQPGYLVVTDTSGLANAINVARRSTAEPVWADVSLAVAALETLMGSGR